MDNLNSFKETIQQFYPVSDGAYQVIEQSLHSFIEGTNTMLDYGTQDVSIVPVFLAKLFNRLENNGSKIIPVTLPQSTSTYRQKYKFGHLLEIWTISNFFEEEVISVVIEDLVQSYSGKEMQIYSVTPYIDKADKHFYTYIRAKSIKINNHE
jgi:hypothetical protein